MAVNTRTSIVPVGISGAFRFKPKTRWWLRPGAITINIGEPVNYKEYENLGIDGLLKRVESKLKFLSGENHEDK